MDAGNDKYHHVVSLFIQNISCTIMFFCIEIEKTYKGNQKEIAQLFS